MPIAIGVWRQHLPWRRRGGNFRFIFVQRSVAAATEIVSCAELNEKTTVASNDFPGIYRGKGCGHLRLGEPERATPKLQGLQLPA